MVDAIGEAFQRAKARGVKYEVYHYMDLSSNLESVLPMVRFLHRTTKTVTREHGSL